MSFTLSALNAFPVKSLQGLSQTEMGFDAIGPLFDRRFMLVDANGRFLSQRRYPVMAQLSATFDGSCLEIDLPGAWRLSLDVAEFSHLRKVTVWGDQFEAYACDDQKLAPLADFLALPLSLVWMSDQVFRQVDREFFAPDRQVSFADGFPVLLSNTASLRELNQRLVGKGHNAVSMARFRANIVVAGSAPYEEDTWAEVQIGEVRFAVVKPCSRCTMVTLDEAGQKSKEPLKTLSEYRRNAFGVCFGQNLVPLNEGCIRLHDELTVLSYK